MTFCKLCQQHRNHGFCACRTLVLITINIKNTLISFLSFCFIIIRNIKGSKSVDARSILLSTVNSAEGLVLVVLCYQEQKGKLLLPVSCVTILSRPP